MTKKYCNGRQQQKIVALICWITTTILISGSSSSSMMGVCNAFSYSSSSSSLSLPSASQLLITKSSSSSSNSNSRVLLYSSFYDSFEEFENNEDDEDDDDDEEDEYKDLDAQSIAAFRSKMGNLFGDDDGGDNNDSGGGDSSSTKSEMSSVDELISYARSKSTTAGTGDETKVNTEWANPVDTIKPGTILVANPKQFCPTDTGSSSSPQPSPSLLAKFGLIRPPPRDLGPDRQADLLPVIVIVEREDSNSNNNRGSTRGVLLNRRTGYLLGDLEQPDPKLGDKLGEVGPILEKFCIQPLWFGGVDNVGTGLDMLHLCETVRGAKKITDDGLYWGGDPAQAQEAMEDPSLGRVITGFDFKFFVQSTIWTTKELDKQIEQGAWFPVEVSKEVLFKSRDRMGTQKAKPLWTEIMDLMGGDASKIKDEFYKEDD